MSEIVETTATTAEPPDLRQGPDAFKVFNETDFKFNWEQRRKIVRYTLFLIGSLYAVAHLAITFAFCWQALRTTLDPNVNYVFTTLIYTDSMMAMSVIMSYVFGVNADMKDLRGRMTDVLNIGRK